MDTTRSESAIYFDPNPRPLEEKGCFGHNATAALRKTPLYDDVVFEDFVQFDQMPTNAAQSPAHAPPPESRPSVPQSTPPPLAQQEPLVPLLKYVDNHLVRRRDIHNKPPTPETTCSVCLHPQNNAPLPSVFLPLSPCEHWVHYWCFIWHCTRSDNNRTQCPKCLMQLYNWDGINALTLATRTNIEMESTACTTYVDPIIGATVGNDKQQYEVDCSIIDIETARAFNIYRLSQTGGAPIDVQVALPLMGANNSRPELDSPADGSPNLVAVFYGTLRALERINRPMCRWLHWHSYLGYMLYAMLVSIKMKRVIRILHTDLVRSEGWREFESGQRVLQGRILGEVRDQQLVPPLT